MSRLPVRWKVTLAFAAALLVVLATVGAFMYLRFDAELSQTLDRSLRSRADEIAGLVARDAPDLRARGARTLEGDESFAQLVAPTGAVLDASPQANVPLLGPEQLRRAQAGRIVVDRAGDERLDEGTRLLAMPIHAEGKPRVLVVGTSLDEKNERLSTLLILELIGLTAALVLASAAGYVVSGVALRPVEAMRRHAAEISKEPDRRLPVPPVDDELGRLGATLNAMLDRLERAGRGQQEAVAKERRFIADASHELRTPLTILKGEIEVALLGDRSAPELHAALLSAGEETDRLCRLAEDLLVLAQADGGGLPIRPSTVSVRELLDEAAARGRAHPAGAHRELTVHAPSCLAVRGDRLRLEQALTNLVENALRHGGGAVELMACEDGGEVRMVVRDHGSGLAQPFVGRAFDRFSRQGSSLTRPGAGLGLAIVEAIAASHQGSVSAENADPGARLELRLPAGG